MPFLPADALIDEAPLELLILAPIIDAADNEPISLAISSLVLISVALEEGVSLTSSKSSDFLSPPPNKPPSKPPLAADPPDPLNKPLAAPMIPPNAWSSISLAFIFLPCQILNVSLAPGARCIFSANPNGKNALLTVGMIALVKFCKALNTSPWRLSILSLAFSSLSKKPLPFSYKAP